MQPVCVVGLLSLQGCVEPHVKHLKALGVETLLVRKPEELDRCDALIIPGGESTTFLKLLELFDFFPALEVFFKKNKPIWGICAGAILMAKRVLNPDQKSLGWVDVEIERNAYGRQLDSEVLTLRGAEVALIRAPRIKKLLKVASHPEVEIKDIRGEEILSVKQGKCFLSTFHPELSETVPSVFHSEFVESARPLMNKPSSLTNTA
jgi:5'-phosphate synthase pdxT subunit